MPRPTQTHPETHPMPTKAVGLEGVAPEAIPSVLAFRAACKASRLDQIRRLNTIADRFLNRASLREAVDRLARSC